MQKIFLPILFICVYCCAHVITAYANDQVPNTVKVLHKGPPGVPNNEDFEKIIKAQEVILRKLKAIHLRKERKQHVLNTDKAFREAMFLYHHKRSDQARKGFANVEDSMAAYKSVDNILRVIDNRSIVQLKKKMYRLREIRATQMGLQLAQRATGIYLQSSYLGENKDTIVVKKKLAKLVGTFQAMSNQVYVQQQLDKIAQEANSFDQEVFKLTQSSNYPAAKKKYEEFQQTMLDDLSKVRQTMAQVNNNSLSVMEPQN